MSRTIFEMRILHADRRGRQPGTRTLGQLVLIEEAGVPSCIKTRSDAPGQDEQPGSRPPESELKGYLDVNDSDLMRCTKLYQQGDTHC